MRRVVVLLLLVAGLQAAPPAEAADASRLRLSIMGGMLHETDGAAYVKFTFVGRGCSRVDVLADISDGPFPVTMDKEVFDHGYPRNRLSMQAIGVHEPGVAEVGAWYYKTDQPQDVTGTGGVQCQGLEHPGALLWKSKTVTIPARKPPPDPGPQGKDSLLNQNEKDNLTSATKGGAVTTAITCGMSVLMKGAGKEACGGSLAATAGSAAATLADPPDPRFRKLVPATFTMSRFAPRGDLLRCRHERAATARRCARINAAYRRWMRTSNEMSWLAVAAGVAANREGNALRRLSGAERTRVVDLQRTALLLYVGRYAVVSERRAHVARRLSVLTRTGQYARRFPVRDRRLALHDLRAGRGLPPAVLARLRRAHLPVSAALRRATRGLDAGDVPASLSRLFAATARLPHRSREVLRGAGSDPATAWPGDGVALALKAWLGKAAGTVVTTCDDDVLGIGFFGIALDRLRADPPRVHGQYAGTLARTLLASTKGLRRPCPPLQPDPTTYGVTPGVVAPPGGDFFSAATDIDVGPDGSLAVADPDAQTVTRYPQDGSAPVVVGAAGALTVPTNVAVGSSGDLYVTDFDAMRVVHFAADGMLLGSWGGQGSGPGQFDRPVGLAIASDGSVVVGDANNARVQVFAPDGTLRRVIPSPPQGALGHLVAPRGIDVSPDGTIAVADRSTASVVLFRLADGAFLGASAPTDEPGYPSPVGLYQPYDVQFDPAGRLWVADRGGHRLVRLEGLSTNAQMIWAFGHHPTQSLQPTAVAFGEGRMLVLDYAQQQVLAVPAP